MVGLMTTLRECADTAAAALAEMLRGAKGEVDTAAVAEVIENVLNQATSETEEPSGVSSIFRPRCRSG